MLSGISGLVLQGRGADGHGVEPACQPSMSTQMGINSTCLASCMEESVTSFFLKHRTIHFLNHEDHEAYLLIYLNVQTMTTIQTLRVGTGLQEGSL